MGDVVVGGEYAGWTTSNRGRPCLCQNCSHWPPAEKTGRGSLLTRPSCPPDDPVGQGTELDLVGFFVPVPWLGTADAEIKAPSAAVLLNDPTFEG